MIIGITGTLGAGKGTVVEYLKEKGFTHYSVSGLLKEMVLAEGQVPSRETYSPMASKIRAYYPGGMAQLIWEKKVDIDKPELAIIESIHGIGEAQFLKDKGAVMLGVDADIKTRYERAVARGSEKDQVSFDEFKKHVEREEEGDGSHNIRAVLDMADRIIMNDGSLEELHVQIDSVLADI